VPSKPSIPTVVSPQPSKAAAVVRPQATGTGGSSDKDSAQQSSGPSATYGSKIIQLIRENTFFNETNLRQYTVKVMVRAVANGKIVSADIIESSGQPAFDDAVIRGIRRIDVLPRDVDGRIPDLLLREGMLITVPFNR
jgi:colicin import membrane protein